MSILHAAQRRYAAKAFDPERKLSEEQITTLKTVLKLSPSSINFQPWHFIIATSQAAKDKIATACQGAQAYNATKIKDSAMMVIFCAKIDATEENVQHVVDQENSDGRYADETVKSERLELISNYIKRLNQDPITARSWLDKQCYIALGNILLAAADMEIDSVPIEGFEASVINEVFELTDKGLHAVVLAGFGYHSEADFNAKLPKSRLPDSEIFTDC